MEKSKEPEGWGWPSCNRWRHSRGSVLAGRVVPEAVRLPGRENAGFLPGGKSARQGRAPEYLWETHGGGPLFCNPADPASFYHVYFSQNRSDIEVSRGLGFLEAENSIFLPTSFIKSKEAKSRLVLRAPPGDTCPK